MDLTSTVYTYEGIGRFTAFWDNPNKTASVLVCLIALTWGLSAGSKVRTLIGVAVEAILTVGLVATYSRGGQIGYIAALVFFCVCIRGTSRSPRHIWPPLGIRVICFMAVCAAAGLFKRDLLALTGDASVGNRLVLWKGLLQLIHASPWSGWGAGRSGADYYLWVQPLSLHHRYDGAVNSYLHCAAEFGLPALFVIATLVLLPLVYLCLNRHIRDTKGASECGAAMVGFATCAFFSTLWVDPSVVAIPLVVLVLLAWRIWAHGDRTATWRAFTHASGIACGVVGTIWILGAALDLRSTWHVSRLGDGGVALTSATAPADTELVLLTDGLSLGNYPGRELREAIADLSSRIKRVVLYTRGQLPREMHGKILAFGPRWRDAYQHAIRPTAVILPTAIPTPAVLATLPERIYLPEYDELGFGETWSRLGGSAILPMRGCGQNATSQLRAILLRELGMQP